MTNSNYRWVIVAAGGVLGCVAIGGMFSLPVFLRPIAQDTGWSVTGVSSAMTIGFLAMALTSMAWGTLSDRLEPGIVAAVVSDPVRAAGRRLDLGHLCADDGVRHWLVRHPSQPRRLAGFGRHGDGAVDHGAARRLADLAP